ncbi:MAG: hypothetical protein IKU45_06220 [Clostridia bacterium]|nr:hypothetical protein [Clostridia bacterium]
MKNFAKFFVVALVVALVASLFAISSSAAQTVDPRDLKPGSNNVVFITDPAEEDGQLPGDGTGKDAENPYQPIDHELFDPEKKTRYYNTAIYQATELLKDTGGTVVICGPVYLDINDGSGDHANTADVYLAENGNNVIKFTSVYNGVDYRETNGAKITIVQPAEIGIMGSSIWENITIETSGTNRLIHCNSYPTLFGEGIVTRPVEEDYASVASYYVSISGGHRWNGGHDLTPNVVVQSGTYNIICSGIWGANNWRSETTKATYNNDGETNAKLTLEGTTTVLGKISGTTHQASEFSGKTEIIINGGSYPCDIFGVGNTGMTNREGIVNIRINGGDFSSTWSLSPAALGHTNNPPAAAILDFTGWTGELASLASAYSVANMAETPFTNIKLPEGVSAEDLQGAAAETTVAQTDAPSVADTTIGGVIIGTVAPENTDEPDAAVGVGGDNGGMNLGLIIAIAAGAVVVIAAVVVVIVVSKKKKANK